MTLQHSPLMYLFLDVSSVAAHRRMLETELALPVIERAAHPPHDHHGVVKYDGGGTILSLNMASQVRFQRQQSDGLTTVFATHRWPPEAGLQRWNDLGGLEATWGFTDHDGHHFAYQRPSPGQLAETTIAELRLDVRDLEVSRMFYEECLGLGLRETSRRCARFGTGTIDLVLQESDSAVDGRPAACDSYLLVFYVPNVTMAARALEERGLRFRRRVGFSEIGGTARFSDPTGHVYCLYEPSDEALSWTSGHTVRRLATSSVDGVLRRR